MIKRKHQLLGSSFLFKTGSKERGLHCEDLMKKVSSQECLVRGYPMNFSDRGTYVPSTLLLDDAFHMVLSFLQ